MRNYIKLIIVIICVNTNLTWSQNQQRQKYIDSLINIAETSTDTIQRIQTYGRLFEQLQFGEPDLAYSYTKKELKLSEKIDYKRGIAGANFHFADFHKFRGNIDSAKYYYNTAEKLFKSANSLIGELFVNHSRAGLEKDLGNYKEALSYAYRNIDIYKQRDTSATDLRRTFNLIGSEYELIGEIHIELGNYRIALNETLKALKFFKEKNDIIRSADALKQLGDIEVNLNNLNKANDYYNEAYSIYDDYNDITYKTFVALSIGNVYLDQNKLKLAEKFFNEALKLSIANNAKSEEGTSLISLGNLNAKLKKYKTAQDLLIKGNIIDQDLGFKSSVSSNLIDLANVEIKLGNTFKALQYTNESINISKELNTKNTLSRGYYLRSLIYEDLNNTNAAFQDFKQYKTINDSIYNTTKSQQIEELKTIYETEKKEDQIVFQKNEIDLLEQKAKVSTLQKVLLGGGLILSLLAISFGFYGFRQKIKRAKLEKQKLDTELDFKKKELTTHALHLAKKNEILESLKQKAEEFKDLESSSTGYQQLIRTINFDLKDDKNWNNFARYFESVHKGFNTKVVHKYPQITPNELRLLSLLKMNLSSKEIANILNISSEGVKKARYRLRKKMNLTSENSLQNLVFDL